jgi:Na+-translocating ferredoxin:NAD+ oxidoreductase subunit D
MNRSPYLFDAPSVSTVMLKVLLALIPGIVVYVWCFGTAILIHIALATATALATEAAMLQLRGRPIKPFLSDLSAVITAWLLALSIPTLTPWWLVVVGTTFAIIVAKQLYGGLGYNPFNPAMAGYAVLLISFPALMTQWPAPAELATVHLSFADQLATVFGGKLPVGIALDAVTSATPLDYLKTQLTLNKPLSEIAVAPMFGALAGKGTEWVALAYLLGGLYMLQQRIITWHLPVAFLASMLLIAGGFHLADSARFASPVLHLLGGASVLGAFFILTDPISSPTTPKGKLLFAFGVALLTYLIRVFGGYADGIAFAVLVFNICVPLIDTYTQPKVFGRR